MNTIQQAPNLWTSSKRIMLVISNTGMDNLIEFRNALKEAGVNVNDSHIICLVASKNDKVGVRELFGVNYIAPSDFNFWGKLKDVGALKNINRPYDLLIVVGQLDKRYLKFIKKINFRVGVGINHSPENLAVNLTSESDSPLHLITFVKNTLMKINNYE